MPKATYPASDSSLRGIPSVERILSSPALAASVETYGRRRGKEALGAPPDDFRRRRAARGRAPGPAPASRREVVVSRGELVEIGGAFRVPDVIQQGGAKLREVGTTNRTRAADYANASTKKTAAFLRVHRSNFEIVGFTETPSIEE